MWDSWMSRRSTVCIGCWRVKMATEERPRRLRERRYVIVSKETVRQHAESVGISELSDEILEALAEDVSYRVREVVQVFGRAVDLWELRRVMINIALLWLAASAIGCSGGRKGGRGVNDVCDPGSNVKWGGMWSGENREFWNLAVCGKLGFALQNGICGYLHYVITPPT